MIKVIINLEQGRMYGFGMTDEELNRLEFQDEVLFFDFGYASAPQLFGVILYLPEFQEPEAIAASLDAAKRKILPFFNEERGVTPETLRVFMLAKKIVQKFRSTPFWQFEANIEIVHPADRQFFFSGPDEAAIETYLQRTGFLTEKTLRTYKGFGRRD